jgi:hypothetical protein
MGESKTTVPGIIEPDTGRASQNWSPSPRDQTESHSSSARDVLISVGQGPSRSLLQPSKLSFFCRHCRFGYGKVLLLKITLLPLLILVCVSAGTRSFLTINSVALPGKTLRDRALA